MPAVNTSTAVAVPNISMPAATAAIGKALQDPFLVDMNRHSAHQDATASSNDRWATEFGVRVQRFGIADRTARGDPIGLGYVFSPNCTGFGHRSPTVLCRRFRPDGWTTVRRV